MFRYVLAHVGRLLRETFAPSENPPPVTVTRTLYLVTLDGTLHHVRRNRTCDCGGTPQSPCPAVPLIQAYLAVGGPRPLGRHESTWPEVWAAVPPLCPVCDCPTVADPYLDSAPGAARVHRLGVPGSRLSRKAAVPIGIFEILGGFVVVADMGLAAPIQGAPLARSRSIAPRFQFPTRNSVR